MTYFIGFVRGYRRKIEIVLIRIFNSKSIRLNAVMNKF